MAKSKRVRQASSNRDIETAKNYLKSDEIVAVLRKTNFKSKFFEMQMEKRHEGGKRIFVISSIFL